MTSEFYEPPTSPYASALSAMSPEQLRALETQSELGEGPIPMVLDTSWVRTGLRYQLANRLVGILHVCLEREVLYDELAAWPVDSERAA